MKKFLLFSIVSLVCFSFSTDTLHKKGWVLLFDGKTLQGWKVGANPQTFKVQNGMIVVNGPVAHLFYDGKLQQHNFKNFELKLDVKTMPGSNSGVYFHTAYQESSWPEKGYEVQVNNSHTDWRRTAGLYGVQDVKEAVARDEEWFTMHIEVRGKRIVVKVNDRVITDYTEHLDVKRDPTMDERVLSSGTIALQGHDPASTVFYKNILLKVLKN